MTPCKLETALAALSVLALCLGACAAGPESATAENGGSAGSLALGGSAGEESGTGGIGAGGSSAGTSGCGSEEIGIEFVEPKVMLVVDRSCSMLSKIDGQTKWQLAVAALNGWLASQGDRIDWGLTLFPDRTGEKCSQDPPQVAIGADSGQQITSLLNSALTLGDDNYPDGPCVTNIDTAVASASSDPAFSVSGDPRYMILITDGKQYGCAENAGDPATLATLAAQREKGIPTFVVGFGGTDKIDPAMMNAFADAGGVPRKDPNQRYYLAESGEALESTLDAISSSVVSCQYTLASKPPNPALLFVFFDDASVARDASQTNGWDYDAENNEIEFFGASCDTLKNGGVKDVDVVFGCNVPTPR